MNRYLFALVAVAVLSGCETAPRNVYEQSPAVSRDLRDAGVFVQVGQVTATPETDTCRLMPFPAGRFTTLSTLLKHGIEVETATLTKVGARVVTVSLSINRFFIDCTNRAAYVEIAGEANVASGRTTVGAKVPLEYSFFGYLIAQNASAALDEAARQIVRQTLDAAKNQ